MITIFITTSGLRVDGIYNKKYSNLYIQVVMKIVTTGHYEILQPTYFKLYFNLDTTGCYEDCNHQEPN